MPEKNNGAIRRDLRQLECRKERIVATGGNPQWRSTQTGGKGRKDLPLGRKNIVYKQIRKNLAWKWDCLSYQKVLPLVRQVALVITQGCCSDSARRMAGSRTLYEMPS